MTRLLVRNLAAGSPYFIQVREISEGIPSDWSYRLAITTNTDTSVPKAPTALTWSSAGRSFIGTWTAPTETTNNQPLYNLDKYQVRITHVASGQSVVYDTKATRFDFTYEMNEAKFGTAKSPLNFEVRAITTTGEINASSWAGPITGTNPVPGPVVLATPIAMVESVILNWTAPSDLDLTGFNIYASQTNAFTPAVGNLVKSVNNTSYTFSTTSASPWYFHVRAVDIFGQESASTQSTGITAKSGVFIDTTAPAAPTGVTATSAYDAARGVSTMTVTWVLSTDDAGGAKDVRNYIIRYSSNGGTNYNYLNVNNGINTARFDVEPGSTYTIGVAAQDFQRNTSAYAATSPATTSAPVDTLTVTPQTMPSANVVGNTLQVQITPTGLDSTGAAMPANVTAYEVYASKTSGFTTYDSTTLIGKIVRSTVTSGVFYLPVTTTSGTAADTWYVRIRAVGKNPTVVSPMSAQTAVTPGLITNSNIVNATIQSAKIVSLVADKITAGAGIIESLTIGNATSAGDIHSFDYVAGTTGWKIGGLAGGSNLLEINSGLIKARALELNNSPNIVPPILADFEAAPRVYTGEIVGAGASWVLDSTAANVKYGSQCLSVTNAGGGAVQLGAGFNIPVEAGKYYVVSGYFRGTGTVQFAGFASDSSFLYGTSIYTVTSNLTRHATVVGPIPATATSMVLYILAGTAPSSFTLDALQVEERTGAVVTPIGSGENIAQPWAPTSRTTINGGQIVTGSIQSKQTIGSGALSTLPKWFIDINGKAQFGDTQVLGALVIGGNDVSGAGVNDVSSGIGAGLSEARSYGFISGTTGWRIKSDGDAEFNNIVARGVINATGGSITGALLLGGSLTTAVTNGSYSQFNATGISLYTDDPIQTNILWSNQGYEFKFLTVGNGLLYYMGGPLGNQVYYTGESSDENGETLFFTAPNVEYVGMGVDYWGAVFLADKTNNMIRKYSDGVLVGSFAVANLKSMAISRGVDGIIYAGSGNNLNRYNVETFALIGSTAVGAPLNRITVGADLKIYGQSGTDLYRYTTAGVNEAVISFVSSGPMNADSLGRLYSAGTVPSGDWYVFQYTSSGSPTGIFLGDGTSVLEHTNLPIKGEKMFVANTTRYIGVFNIPNNQILSTSLSSTTGSLYSISPTLKGTTTADFIKSDVVNSRQLQSDIIVGKDLRLYASSSLLIVASGRWDNQRTYIDSRVQSSVQGVPTSTTTTLGNLGTVTWNDVGFSYSDGIWTCQIAGWYDILAQASFSGNATGSRRITINRNGTPIGRNMAFPGNTSQFTMQVTAFRKFNVGDEVTADMFQNSGVSLETSGDGLTYMSVVRRAA